MKSLKQLNKISTKDLVINSLQDYIIRNNLKEGDSLPAEQVLAETLAVSRNILREALQYFRTLGIIASRPKTGAYIEQLTPVNPFQGFFPYFSSDKNRLEEIAQLRQIVELGAVPSILAAVTSEHIERLRLLAEEMKIEDLEERKRVDIEFHSEFLRICDNQILNSLKPLLIDYFENCALKRKQSPKSTADIYLDHIEIINALANRDQNALQKAILKHYGKSVKKNKE
jgi:DNA-binding FadR family transcriptional regulator